MGTMPRAVANTLSSLAHKWDESDTCRTSVRDRHVLLRDGKPTFHATVKSCSGNHEAISPVLSLTAEPLDFINAKLKFLINSSSLLSCGAYMFLHFCDLICVTILPVTYRSIKS